MALFGKVAGSARKFMDSDAGQAILSTLSSIIPGDPYEFMQRRRAQEQRDAQRQQMLAAYSDLAGMMAAPDAQIEGANELVAGANPTAARMGMAPLPLQASRPTGFTGNPEQMKALMQFVGAGGGLDAVSGLGGLIAPKRETFTLGKDQVRYDADGSEIARGPAGAPDRITTDNVIADIASRYTQGRPVNPQEMAILRDWQQKQQKLGQWAPVRGRSDAAPTAGPSIDQPWTLFRQ